MCGMTGSSVKIFYGPTLWCVFLGPGSVFFFSFPRFETAIASEVICCFLMSILTIMVQVKTIPQSLHFNKSLSKAHDHWMIKAQHIVIRPMKELVPSFNASSWKCGTVYTTQLYLQGYSSLTVCTSGDLLNIDRCHHTSAFIFFLKWDGGKKPGQETWKWSKGKYRWNGWIQLCSLPLPCHFNTSFHFQ